MSYSSSVYPVFIRSYGNMPNRCPAMEYSCLSRKRVLASHWLTVDYFGFQASCHNTLIIFNNIKYHKTLPIQTISEVIHSSLRCLNRIKSNIPIFNYVTHVPKRDPPRTSPRSRTLQFRNHWLKPSVPIPLFLWPHQTAPCCNNLPLVPRCCFFVFLPEIMSLVLVFLICSQPPWSLGNAKQQTNPLYLPHFRTMLRSLISSI
jgi:hypothetical protein